MKIMRQEQIEADRTNSKCIDAVYFTFPLFRGVKLMAYGPNMALVMVINGPRVTRRIISL